MGGAYREAVQHPAVAPMLVLSCQIAKPATACRKSSFQRCRESIPAQHEDCNREGPLLRQRMEGNHAHILISEGLEHVDIEVTDTHFSDVIKRG